MTFLRWAPISPQRAPERKRGEGSTGANAPDRCRSVRIGGPAPTPAGGVPRRPRPPGRGPVPPATGSLVREGDAPAGEVVGGHGESPPVAREHGEAKPPHLARNGGEHGVAVR